MDIRVGKKIVHTISLFGIALSIWMVVYFIRLGVFQDTRALEGLLGDRVILGPILFILTQIIQIVVPIIPGGTTNVAGVLLFGPVLGFAYNFIGNVIGSIILFLLGKKFGKNLALTLVNEKTYNKYIGKLDNGKKWSTFFTIMMISPVAPDDALVLMTSLTKMSLKKFTAIVVVGKFASIAVYSYLLMYGGELLTKFLIR